MTQSTDDFTYSALLPANSTEVVESNQTMDTPVGQALVFESTSEAEGLVFFLAIVDTQTDANLSELFDSAELAPAITGALGGGGDAFQSHPVSHNGRQGTELVIAMPYQGQEITTRARLFVVGDEIAFFGVGSLPDSGMESSPSIDQFLGSLEIQENN